MLREKVNSEIYILLRFSFDRNYGKLRLRSEVKLIYYYFKHMLSHILRKFNCCSASDDVAASEEKFLAPGDLQEQNLRVKKAHQPFHPAIQRSGMRFNGNHAKGKIYTGSSATGNPNGTIVFGAQYEKRS